MADLRTRMPALYTLVSILAVVGCADIVGPGLPTGSVPLLAFPGEYEGWWDLVERCSGLTGRLSDVRWYVVPGAKEIPGRADGASGIYRRGSHEIVLVEAAVKRGSTVRHEMLHALLRGGHVREAFIENCGGIVSCTASCLTETGGYPTPALNSTLVEAGFLDLRLEVIPDTLRRSSIARKCVSLVVSARNPTDAPIHVEASISTSQAFGWQAEGLGGGSGGGPPMPEAVMALGPGMTRYYVYDCPSLLAEGVRPGRYLLMGRFGTARSAPVELTVVP